jgi:DNA-binding NarL/FixJ family response regulator
MTTHRCRVLLVDDNERVRESLRSLLAPHDDIEIVGEASDGEEAIIQVASCQPEIILMDINMPRMNGIQATNVIKKSPKEMAIIGVCLVDDGYAIEAFLKAGGLAVVSKERLNDLHSTIQRACAHRVSASTSQSCPSS